MRSLSKINADLQEAMAEREEAFRHLETLKHRHAGADLISMDRVWFDRYGTAARRVLELGDEYLVAARAALALSSRASSTLSPCVRGMTSSATR